jgi:transposase-like protein
MTEPSEEVKEVERRYEETIDKMHRLIGRLKTERMSQSEFEQYAKEHGYIISTTNIIEQVRDEIEQSRYGLVNDGLDLALKIIDKYIKGENK